MSKYSFEKLGSSRFEQLVQALLERNCRAGGNLIQFGDGKDGAREATWSQPQSHENYSRPTNETKDVNKEWVFQAKFHDTELRGWDRARADVESELHKELDKIVNKYVVPCHKYILVTNVPFTGVRHVGTRDKVNVVISSWKASIPEIEVWDATDLSRMLDADPDTRTSFLGEVLPGDILREILENQVRTKNRNVNSFRTYLKSLLRSERDARAEEAGDEGGLKLENVFVDLDLDLNQKSADEIALPFVSQMLENRDRLVDYESSGTELNLPKNIECVPASFALLRASHKAMLVMGGPGVGKSTLTQFLTLYHAARLVNKDLANRLAKRLKHRGGLTSESLDSHCCIRFPLRIELRRYAKWVSETGTNLDNYHFAAYFAETINRESSSSLDMESIFELASQNPILLVLDGLDEVPQPSTRDIIFKELHIFLDRCETEECDIQVIVSSRPQGYRGEFDGFQPLEWRVADLSREDFDDYAGHWLAERIASSDEREDASRRLMAGMDSHAVQLMAKTLLQATVMLTIAKRKHAIPHAKHKLYEKFVDVIFEREQNKLLIVRSRTEELKRLHEKVGFELICKMERDDGAQTLKGSEFRSCVERVILDYGRIKDSTTSSKEIVDEILVLAKDRLCLLAGKGEDQEEVDFVIQPFREYFAAAYLAGHEDADPSLIYSALMARQHIWANVLQFYAAFQSASQQRNWISEADGSGLNAEPIENIIEVTKRRRTLIRVLPEFAPLRNEYVKRAFLNLMNVTTRWAWRNRALTAGLLEAFAPTMAFYSLKSIFGDFSTRDQTSLFVELDLLIKTSNKTQLGEISEILSMLLQEGATRKVAIEVALENEVILDVSHSSAEELRPFMSGYDRFSRNRLFLRSKTWKGLSAGKYLDLALTHSSPISIHQQPHEESWVNDLVRYLRGDVHRESQRIEFNKGFIGVLLPVYFFSREEPSTIELIIKLLADTQECSVKDYLLSLIQALRNPTSTKHYEVAEAEENKLKFKYSQEFSVQSQLGPRSSLYDSEDAWAEARVSVFNRDETVLTDWLDKLDEKYLWVLLFFPPATWQNLEPLISKNIVNGILGATSDRVIKLSANSVLNISLIQHYSFDNDIFIKLIKTLVSVVSRTNSEFLDMPGLKTFLILQNFKVLNRNDAYSLIHEIRKVQVPQYFSEIVLSACICAEEIDAKILFNFWSEYCRSSESIPLYDSSEMIYEKILALECDDAVIMLATLSKGRRSKWKNSSKVKEELSKRYCRLMSERSVVNTIELARLFNLPVHVDEIYLWSSGKLLNELPNTDWHHDAFEERILDLVNSFSSEHAALRNFLSNIVLHRETVSPRISLIAIDAILRIDELDSPPLEDADWKT